MIEIKSCKPLNKGEYTLKVFDGNKTIEHRWHRETVINEGLLIHKNISLELYASLSNKDFFYRAKDDALKKLSRRFYPIQRITDYLIEQGYAEPIVEQVVNDLIEKKLLCERTAIDAFIEDFLHNPQKGPVYLRHKLLAEGYDDALVEETLKRYTPEIALSACFHVIERLTPTLKETPVTKQKETLTRRLSQRGFAFETIQLALQKYIQTVPPFESNEANLKETLKRYQKRYNLEDYNARKRLIAKLMREGYSYQAICACLKEIS